MKNPLALLSILLFFSSNASFSQFNSTSFSVSKDDLEINEFPTDSTANALVIYEYGNSYIDDDSFKLITEIKRKVKVLNKEGFEKSNVEIPLYETKKSKEKVKNIKATTYNLVDGNITQDQLDSKHIYTEEFDNKYNITKFTLPNIKEGSVIAYTYTIESSFIYKYHGWEFQEDIPKLYSEYNTSVPAVYDYYIKLVGSLQLDHKEMDLKRHCLEGGNGAYADCTISKYVMKNIPAFTEEDHMTSKHNYLSRIEYELNTVKYFDGRVDKIAKTWKDADSELKTSPAIGRQLNKKTNLTGLITDLPKANNLEKVKTIYHFIQDRFTWNKKHRLFKEVDVKDLEQNRSGNATEINILLHNALLENDFDVKPVLISTRQNGLPTKLYPVISEFNYLIVMLDLDGETYFLDATDKYLSFGQLPFKCLNEYGRLLDFKEGSYWVEVGDESTSIQQHQVLLNLTKDNTFEGTLNSKYTGYHALDRKKLYFPDPDSYIEGIEEKQINIDIKNHEVKTDAQDDTFTETYDIIFNEDNIIEDKIYLNPFIIKFFDENPFKLQERTYDIDFGHKNAYVYSFKISLGDAYKIVETPQGLNLRLPNKSGSFYMNSELKDDSTLELIFKLNFNKSKYASGYYQVLKKMMNNVVNSQLNSIVVLEKNQ